MSQVPCEARPVQNRSTPLNVCAGEHLSIAADCKGPSERSWSVAGAPVSGLKDISCGTCSVLQVPGFVLPRLQAEAERIKVPGGTQSASVEKNHAQPQSQPETYGIAE